MSSWAILGEKSFVSEIIPFLEGIVTWFSSIYLYVPIQELMALKSKFLQTFSKPISHSSFLIHGEIILAAIFIKKLYLFCIA